MVKMIMWRKRRRMMIMRTKTRKLTRNKRLGKERVLWSAWLPAWEGNERNKEKYGKETVQRQWMDE